ncbi:MAG: hypothetical protein CH104c_0193 [Candidatus Woesebacteria bacterium]|nr:MAG: hypothetical protein CH104c_0193 [Candidatus Woesebacteria bacterium]
MKIQFRIEVKMERVKEKRMIAKNPPTSILGIENQIFS